ncbi:MAG TPA: ABC transporter ATP-binding protein [Candidatus Limnocylindria bacterium]|nr:ABC transporter ATP-binding protein [Candidatus Limnocylindria bacterium]
MSAPLLQVEDLTTAFPSDRGPAAVVDGVSLVVDAGEVVALVGESGCGKSMTALSILRLVPPPGRVTGGRILLDGEDLLTLPVPAMRRVRGKQIAMIFQEPGTSLNPVLTVGAQVVEAIRLHEDVSRAAARARTIELFEHVGIPDPSERIDVYPHQLSGGMKQRVMIAMALAARPRLLIADEPTTALDVTIQAQILELLDRLRRELGMAVLLISHDFGIVNALADRVAVMYAGQIVERGTRADLLAGARHPYTTGLLRAMPARAARGERLAEIPGVVPPPSQRPVGCRFSTRCPARFEPCATIDPDWTMRSATHGARCHAVAEGRV